MSYFHFEFDFDYWSQLARRDPVAFFAARERIIREFIASAPAASVADLEVLQALIDGTRLQAGNPIKAVRQLMGMIGDHLDALRAQMTALRAEADALAGKSGKNGN